MEKRRNHRSCLDNECANTELSKRVFAGDRANGMGSFSSLISKARTLSEVVSLELWVSVEDGWLDSCVVSWLKSTVVQLVDVVRVMAQYFLCLP